MIRDCAFTSNRDGLKNTFEAIEMVELLVRRIFFDG